MAGEVSGPCLTGVSRKGCIVHTVAYEVETREVATRGHKLRSCVADSLHLEAAWACIKWIRTVSSGELG